MALSSIAAACRRNIITRSFLLFIIAFSCLQLSASAETVKTTPTGQNGVITLNTANFDKLVGDGNVWLVEFYAPWCGHCVRFAPTYEQVATELHTKQKQPGAKRKVNVGKVDGAAERALASRFSVQGFPVFFLIDGWTVYEFNGNRSQEGLIQFALTDYENTDPVPFLFGPFGPVGQIRSFMMRSGTWAVGIYGNLTDKGYSPLVSMAFICVGMLTVGFVLIVLLGFLLLPKAKID